MHFQAYAFIQHLHLRRIKILKIQPGLQNPVQAVAGLHYNQLAPPAEINGLRGIKGDRQKREIDGAGKFQ